jgi:hypothetical protein
MIVKIKYQEVGKSWSVGQIMAGVWDGCVGTDGALYIKGINGLFNTKTRHYITDLTFQINLHHFCSVCVEEL